jgi:hypothetical protein
MMMIIETSLYKPCIEFVFIIKTITPWSSTMTITNGRLVDNYALGWPFLTIMCQSDWSSCSFFSSFFGNVNSNNRSRRYSTCVIELFAFHEWWTWGYCFVGGMWWFKANCNHNSCHSICYHWKAMKAL